MTLSSSRSRPSSEPFLTGRQTPPVDVPALVAAARAGQPRALARLVTLVEDGHPALREALSVLAQGGTRAHVVGLTGAPGVGKSTTTNALVGELRARGRRVAVLAVDPSSPYTGGALLGDRIRMQDHALDDGVYIRSMASRGHLGGLSATAPLAVRVLEGVGFDVVLVETVGVGQSEVEVAGLADSTVVLLAPGLGDGIQAAKAGILEVADLLVVNKADREGARRTVSDLRHMMSFTTAGDGGWEVPVLLTVASSGTGVGELADALEGHLRWLARHGGLAERRARRAREEVLGVALAALRGRLLASGSLEPAVESVLSGRADPFEAADRVVDEVSGPLPADSSS